MSTAQKKRRASRTSGKTKTTPRPKAADAANQFLSGYLVVWRHTMDDVPLGLFRTKERALAYAKKISFRAGYAVARKLDIGCRTPVCFAVIKFDNGGATEMTIIDRRDDALQFFSHSPRHRTWRGESKKTKPRRSHSEAKITKSRR